MASEKSTPAQTGPPIDETIEQSKRMQIEFLFVELHTSLAFAQRAFSTGDPSTRERNRKNARKGYDTLLEYLGTADLEPEDAAQLTDGLHQLQTELRELGEVL